MNKFLAILSIFLLTSVVYAEGNSVLKTEKDRISYSIGMDIGNNFKKQSLDIDPDILTKGIKDALSGSKPLMTEQETIETMTNLRKEVMAKQAEMMKEAGTQNKVKGDKFLAENKKKDGVITLSSGLQYKIINKGSGDSPKLTDEVSVNYRGTLIDGTEFDSSYRRGKPATFKVNAVISGWTEALQIMKPGSKWQLYIPSSLAYGERGAGRDIGPNAALIFDVELLSVNQ
jgi:FKBP-type peptidyl-prolyl cis-trans isomerase FklB